MTIHDRIIDSIASCVIAFVAALTGFTASEILGWGVLGDVTLIITLFTLMSVAYFMARYQ